MEADTTKKFSWTFVANDDKDSINFMAAVMAQKPTDIVLANIDMRNCNINAALGQIFSPENAWLSGVTRLSLSSARSNEDILIDWLASPMSRHFDSLTDLSLAVNMELGELVSVYKLLRDKADKVTSLTLVGKDRKQQETKKDTHDICKFISNTVNMTSIKQLAFDGYNFSAATKNLISDVLRGWKKIEVAFDGVVLPIGDGAKRADGTIEKSADDLYSYYDDFTGEDGSNSSSSSSSSSSSNSSNVDKDNNAKKCKIDLPEGNDVHQ